MKTLIFISLFFSLSIYLPFSYEVSTKASNIKQYSNNDSIQAPILLQPAQNQYISDTTCTFIWYSTHPKHVYEVFVSTTEDFTKGERFASRDTLLMYNLSTLNNKTIYWKVRAFKNKKEHSA